ncbi:MAG TPA: hypothetical protein VJA45_09395 [Methylomirabilota bacterium]|nr:hypothetical protein [Methylomirabilota bacterium]
MSLHPLHGAGVPIGCVDLDGRKPPHVLQQATRPAPEVQHPPERSRIGSRGAYGLDHSEGLTAAALEEEPDGQPV